MKKYHGNCVYIGWLKNQLYLHNFACDLLMLCRESLRLERTLKTIKSNQHPHQLSIFSILMVGRGSGLVMTAVLATLFVYTDQERVKRDQLSPSFVVFFFLNKYLQAETKGEIFVCGGTVERGEFVHNTHNKTSYWLEQCLWHSHCSAVPWCHNNQWKDIPSTLPLASQIKTW